MLSKLHWTWRDWLEFAGTVASWGRLQPGIRETKTSECTKQLLRNAKGENAKKAVENMGRRERVKMVEDGWIG